MKRFFFIGFLLPVLLMVACRRDDTAADGPQLCLTLEFPASPLTKAGEVPAETAEENVIHDLKIWIFKSGGEHEPVVREVYNNPLKPDELPQAGTVKKYVFPVPRSLAVDRPDLDIFVLANSASIGCNLGKDASYTDLTNALFGDDANAKYFSPASPVTPASSAVLTNGLPMSGMGTGLKISGEEYSLSVDRITIQRAVSKMRYVFCQMLNTGADAETMMVTRIVLDGGLIPNQEYVFSPDGGLHIVDEEDAYVETAIETTNSVTVPSSAVPELYTYTGSGASGAAAYESLILEAIEDHKLLCPGTFYLRETGKALSGKVYYTVTKNNITSEEKSRTFSMKTPDFIRNHSWTMYAYFISDRTLMLSLNVLPWDMNTYDIDFTTASASVTVPLTVDPFSVSSIDQVGDTDDFNVLMKAGTPARAYLNIVTPSGGRIEVSAKGEDGSDQYFKVTQNSTTIDSKVNNGRIDITVDLHPDKASDESYHGKSITLDFKVFTPDEDNPTEVALDSEAINQIYHFILP